MKQKILYTLFLAGLLASCNSDEEIVKNNPGYLESGYGALTVKLSDPSLPQVRAVGDRIDVATKEEKTIKSVAFFVNTEATGEKPGNFGKYFSDELPLSENGLQEPLVAQATDGEYTCQIRHRSDGWNNPQVIVVANYAENGLSTELKGVTTFADLQAVLTATVAANPATPLLMYSNKTIESWKPTGGFDGGGIVAETFTMDRLVSRIDIHNMAYKKGDEAKGFVLKSAQLIRPRTGSYLMPGSTKTAPVVSPTPFAALTNVADFETNYQKIDTLYAYENANAVAAEATAIQINGTFLGTPVSKIIEFRKPMVSGVAGDPIALARNNRYVVNINPTPDSTDINWTIVVKPWTEADTIKVKPAYEKPEVDWANATFTGTASIWNATAKTIDITDLTATGVKLEFTASGDNLPDVAFAAKYDADASSIGGTDALKGLITKEDPVLPYADGKITRKFTVTIPKQTAEKVPLDLYLCVYNSASEKKADTIKIMSRPNYNGLSGLKPVLFKGQFWAPVNVGATTTTVSATVDIASAGLYYQFGRNFGFSSSIADADKTQGPISYEDVMGKFEKIYPTTTAADSAVYDWLKKSDLKYTTRNELWTPEVDDSPCPTGWRVPTKSEYDGIAAAVAPGGTFDKTAVQSKRLTVKGDIGGEFLYFPLASRIQVNGKYEPNDYGQNGGFYTSSILSSKNAYHFQITTTAATCKDTRGNGMGMSIRCIQK